MNDLDCGTGLVDADSAGQIMAQAHAQLVLKAGADQVGWREDMASRQAMQDAAENRFVEPELLLHRLRRHTNFPADLLLAGCAATGDQTQLNAVRLVDRQLVEPCTRKELAPVAGFPEAVDQGRVVQTHDTSSLFVEAGMSRRRSTGSHRQPRFSPT